MCVYECSNISPDKLCLIDDPVDIKHFGGEDTLVAGELFERPLQAASAIIDENDWCVGARLAGNIVKQQIASSLNG